MNAANVHHCDADLKAQDSSGTTSFFRLPAELRLMIWRMLLPDKRMMKVHARYGISRQATARHITPARTEQSPHEPRWFLRPSERPYTPVLLEICQESRALALQHGNFAFQGSQIEDTGMWWNSSVDTLVFGELWNVYTDPWAFVGIQGLENVRRVGLCSSLAEQLVYMVTYRQGTDETLFPPELRDPLTVGFTFRQHPDAPHFIPEFFSHVDTLYVYFESFKSIKDPEDWPPDYSHLLDPGADEHSWSVTFQLVSEINMAIRQLAKLRYLFMMEADLTNFSSFGRLMMMDEAADSSPLIMYGIKDGVDPNELGNAEECQSVVTMRMIVLNDPKCL